MNERAIGTSFELFTGAGGLALGVAAAGFTHVGVVEWNPAACASLRENATRISYMADWPVFETDVRAFDFRPYLGRVRLLAAGAPCQPFSLGGKHRGDADQRNMFPEVFRAVREMAPEIIIIENVKGLLRSSFNDYFEYVKLQLANPEFLPKPSEDWSQHKRRLESRAAKVSAGLTYNITHQLFNAADYGIPQRRERVFIVGFRSDLRVGWTKLRATHSEDALLHAQWVDGSYWEQHARKRRPVPKQLAPRVNRLASELLPPSLERWRTVRDALAGLPEPAEHEHPTILNHVGNPGARAYPGHTGSPHDEPAKTLKAGDHGVPGGENMLRYDDGRLRYFTVREAARLQGFPDDYHFQGAWCEGFRQLGNAVPVQLARVVAAEARRQADAGARVVQHGERGKVEIERVA